MIYIVNAKDYLLYPVMKKGLNLSDYDVYQVISDEFSLLQKRLSAKHVSYEKLKGALIPNQEEDKYETCLVIDTSQMDDCNYGYSVFHELIPLLDTVSTYSILCGDYFDILSNVRDSQLHLQTALNDVLHRCNSSSVQWPILPDLFQPSDRKSEMENRRGIVEVSMVYRFC